MRLSVSVQGDFVQEMFDVATQFLENEHELVLWVYSHTANTLPAQNLRCRQVWFCGSHPGNMETGGCAERKEYAHYMIADAVRKRLTG